MNQEKMGMSTPKQKISKEINAGIQEHQGLNTEEEKKEMLRERKEKLYGSLTSLERSHKDFLNRIKDEMPNELENITSEMLMKLERAGLNWYNYDNAFFKDGKTGKPRVAQSKVSGWYGIPEDAKDLFVFDHMTYSERKWGEEAFLYGESDDLKNIPEEFDIVPDWIIIEKLKAKKLFLESQKYEMSEVGISKFLLDKHEATEKLNKVINKYTLPVPNEPHVRSWPSSGTEELRTIRDAEHNYKNNFNPEMTRFFGISEKNV